MLPDHRRKPPADVSRHTLQETLCRKPALHHLRLPAVRGSSAPDPGGAAAALAAATAAVSHRTSPELARYLTTGEDPPIRVADDITDPVTEVDYELRFLPPSDAFYMFKVYLGEKRLLPGRYGPPGAIYNTLPAFKPLLRQMIAFHCGDEDVAYADWIKNPDRGYGKLAARFAKLLDTAGD